MPRIENPPFIPCTGIEDEAQRMHNAASFVDIPHDQLPWRDVKLALEIRALSGYDCYAYASSSLTSLVLDEHHQRQWVIWDRQPESWQDSRFTPREWAIALGYTAEELDVSDRGDGGDAA